MAGFQMSTEAWRQRAPHGNHRHPQRGCSLPWSYNWLYQKKSEREFCSEAIAKDGRRPKPLRERVLTILLLAFWRLARKAFTLFMYLVNSSPLKRIPTSLGLLAQGSHKEVINEGIEKVLQLYSVF
jgi:hypothetical protein